MRKWEMQKRQRAIENALQGESITLKDARKISQRTLIRCTCDKCPVGGRIKQFRSWQLHRGADLWEEQREKLEEEEAARKAKAAALALESTSTSPSPETAVPTGGQSSAPRASFQSHGHLRPSEHVKRRADGRDGDRGRSFLLSQLQRRRVWRGEEGGR
ncbi:hypothetical protein L202_04632, partial [Cryptococcus amylolentus CBS 6039]